MLDISVFNKIFQTPTLHNRPATAGEYDPKVSFAMTESVYKAMSNLKVATTNELADIVGCTRSTVQRCIHRLSNDNRIERASVTKVKKATVIRYKVKA